MAREKKATGDATKKRTSRNTPVAAAQQATKTPESGNVQTLQAVPPINGGTPSGDEVIRRRAYELWEQRGREHGLDADDWYRAESELRGKSA